MRRSPLFDSVTQPNGTDRTPAGEGADRLDVSASIDHRELYRLPWSLPDNAIAWLEPTKKCNLACLGCYRENDPRGHKTLAEVRHDLDVFERFAPWTACRSLAATRSCIRRSSRSSGWSLRMA